MENYNYKELKLHMFPSALFHQMGVNGKVSGNIYAISEIPNAVAIVHGAVGCGYHYRYSARTRKSLAYEVFSSNLQEDDIVFGGEEKLLQTIIYAHEQLKPDLIVVVPTSVSDIIQDDLPTVVARARQEYGIKVILSKSELFSHRDKSFARKKMKELASQDVNKSQSMDIDITGCGYSETMCALVEQVMKPQEVTPKTVNIETIAWGVSGNEILKEIGETLAEVGINIHAYIPSASVDVIEKMPSAALNIVKRNHWAKKMREEFGTPYLDINSLRYEGLEGIQNFFTDVGNVLGLYDETMEMVARQTDKVQHQTSEQRSRINSYKAYIIVNNISQLPYVLKLYKETYNLNIVGCMVSLTKQYVNNSGIDDDMLETLKNKISQSVDMYYANVEVKINLSFEELKKDVAEADVIMGTNNYFYENLGKPIITKFAEELSLSFESYVRSINDLNDRLEKNCVHKSLILNKLPFSEEFFPLIQEESIVAGRQMWNRMWLERGDK